MKKVAIINRTNMNNFGSVLQCYALERIVSDLGYDATILWEKGSFLKNFDLRPRKFLSIIRKMIINPSLIAEVFSDFKFIFGKRHDSGSDSDVLFRKFVDENIVQKTVTHSELKRIALQPEYIKFICGSDQVWASTALYVDPLMYLRFSPSQKRIAYAPSLGRDYIPKYNRSEMKRYISEIPNVSVREIEGQRLVRELTGKNVPVVSDPTLLYGIDEWRALENKDCGAPSNYLLTYFLNMPSSDVQNAIFAFSKANGLKIVQLGYCFNSDSNEVECIQPNAGPREFLSLTDNANYVVTDSYHGMLFSLIFEKQFCSVERNYGKHDQSSRQKTVLNQLGIEDRYLTCDCDEKNTRLDYLLTKRIDYSEITKTIDQLARKSVEYLKNAISGD